MINYNALLWCLAIANFFASGVLVGWGVYGPVAAVCDLLWLWFLWGHWKRT